MQERLELVETLQQTLRRAETLPEVEAELAQKVAALSKVLLWVPGGGRGEGLFPCCPTMPLPVLLSPHRSADAGVVLLISDRSAP